MLIRPLVTKSDTTFRGKHILVPDFPLNGKLLFGYSVACVESVCEILWGGDVGMFVCSRCGESILGCWLTGICDASKPSSRRISRLMSSSCWRRCCTSVSRFVNLLQSPRLVSWLRCSSSEKNILRNGILGDLKEDAFLG